LSALAWLIIWFGLAWPLRNVAWYRFCVSWAIACASDVALLSLHLARSNTKEAKSIPDMVFRFGRLFLILGLVGNVPGFLISSSEKLAADKGTRSRLDGLHRDQTGAEKPQNSDLADSKWTATVNGDAQVAAPNGIAQRKGPKGSDREHDKDKKDSKQYSKLEKDYWTFTKAFAILIPYLWPSNQIQ
jgi:hypothetical protein